MRWSPLFMLPLLACSGSDDGGGTTTPSVEVDLSVAPGPLPGIAIATVTTSEDSIVELEYGLGATDRTHPDLSQGGTEHRFVVLGLKAGQDYQFEAVVSAQQSATRSDVVTAASDPLPDDVPTFSVTTGDPSARCDPGGYVMFVWIGQGNSGISILDSEGDTVWALPLIDTDFIQANRARVATDGSGLVYTTAHALRQDLLGEVVLQPIDGSEPVVTSAPTAHHDALMLPDGTLGWLGYSFGTYECADGESIDDTALDTIEEALPGGNPTVVHDMFDDYPNPLDCEDGDPNFLPGRFDLSHANSLMYLPDDSYLYMTRWHDNVVKVDRASGDVIWELGGDHDQFQPATGQDPEDLFFHAHMSDAWLDGMLVFDNNDPNPSWVREYALDTEARTWEQVWGVQLDTHEFLLGDVHRVPECSDRVLVTQSTKGIVQEMLQDDAGTIVWAVDSDVDNTIVTRVQHIPDLYDLTTANLPGDQR